MKQSAFQVTSTEPYGQDQNKSNDFVRLYNIRYQSVLCYPVEVETYRWADPRSKEYYQNVKMIHSLYGTVRF